MDKKTLLKYCANKKELALIDASIELLYRQLEDVPAVAGKVTKSSDDFPYIEEHITVQIAEPKTADTIKKKIREKEVRRQNLLKMQREVEAFIAQISDGAVREIFELTYIEGMPQRVVGEYVGYTQGRISQIMKSIVKD